jgi:anti-sigma B factor antagonist
MTRAAKPTAGNAAEAAGAPSHAAPLCLEGELTIYRAQEIHQGLLAALAGTDALELDLQKATEIDSSGVQLLIAARRAATAAGKTLVVTAISPAVREVFELFDLTAMLGECAPAAVNA